MTAPATKPRTAASAVEITRGIVRRAGTGKVPARRSGWLPGQADADRAAPERQLVARDVEVLEAVVVEGAEVADVGADGEAAAPHERADAAVPPETVLRRLEIEKVVLDVRP